MEIGTLAIITSALPLLLVEEPIPQHNSLLAGRMYYKEVMKSQSYRRFMNVARINKETSLLLKKCWCRMKISSNRCRSTLARKTMIFIHLLIGHTNRQAAERWQHSGSIISVIIHEISEAFRKCSDLILVWFRHHRHRHRHRHRTLELSRDTI